MFSIYYLEKSSNFVKSHVVWERKGTLFDMFVSAKCRETQRILCSSLRVLLMCLISKKYRGSLTDVISTNLVSIYAKCRATQRILCSSLRVLLSNVPNKQEDCLNPREKAKEAWDLQFHCAYNLEFDSIQEQGRQAYVIGTMSNLLLVFLMLWVFQTQRKKYRRSNRAETDKWVHKAGQRQPALSI